uniref:Uncharacterized protein n=1 Tax=Ditylenchus dipsaci TaxID=166011 RepID=A0A915CZX3_9BILA
MLKNYCLLILALCVVNIYCKGIQPADEQAPKNDKKVVGSNEEFGPSRAAHEAMFGKDVDDYPELPLLKRV